MTNRRQFALNFAVEYLGHENPFTITIFTISEKHPEKEYDNIIGDLVETYVMRYFESLNEDDEDDYDHPEEDDYDHPDYDPYCGCDMPDIFGLEW